MASTVPQRALDILEAALELPEPEQAGFLAGAARDDAALAAELRRLEPARHRTAQLLATGGGFGALAPELPPPARIGPFHVGRLLGRGGMGSVYEGERDDGLFEQRVAIKLLAIRHWSNDLQQSLASERRILARLEHRNIARLFDGGVTSDGRSYIVMERIDGEPITDYAAHHAPGLEARVRLFGQLSAALQYAHQQLVVHADIKPSNVLVSADGSVKLLDFGIAALLDRDATEPPDGGTSRPLTRAYAPPERSGGQPPTVAGDVYSAGVVLRELLEAVTAELPADLASVVRKATAAEPSARYGSVAELREDLASWLDRLPVHAHGGGWRYRAGRFVARNRVATLLAALIFVGLSAATVVSARLYLRAERANAVATQRLDQVIELNSYLVDDLSSQLGNRPGMVDANWQTLSEALRRLEQLARDRPADPALQLALARNVVHIAQVAGAGYRSGFVDLREVRTRLAATTQRLEALPGNGAHHAASLSVRATIASLESLMAFQVDGDVRAASERSLAALAFARAARRLAPTSPEAEAALGRATLAYAGTLNASGRGAEALAALEPLLRAAQRPVDADAEDLRLAAIRYEAAFMRCDIKRWLRADDDALRECEGMNAQLRQAIDVHGALIFFEARLAYGLFLVGSQMQARGENARALALLDEARDLYARILHFGANEELSGNALVVESARATALAGLGRIEEARASAAALLQARRARLAAEPGTLVREREVATALRRVGEVELTAQQPDRACQAFADAGAIWDRLERQGRLLAFDQAPVSGQVPWIRAQLRRCP